MPSCPLVNVLIRDRWRLTPVGLIPITLAVIANLAEHLKIRLLQRQFRKQPSRFDVIDVDPDAVTWC